MARSLCLISRKTDNENKEDDVSDDEFDHKDLLLLANSVCIWHRAWVQRHDGMRRATSTAKL